MQAVRLNQAAANFVGRPAPAQGLSPEQVAKLKAMKTEGLGQDSYFPTLPEGAKVAAKIRLPKPGEGKGPSEAEIAKLKEAVEARHAGGEMKAKEGRLLIQGEGAPAEGPSLLQRLQALLGGEG